MSAPIASLSAGEAAELIVAAVRPQPPLRMPLTDALHHVLAEDLVAPIPLPPWTNAAMDGYAVRAEDVRPVQRATPVQLHMVGISAAGTFPDRELGPGEAMRVFTGAPLPAGADSVIRQEDTDRGGVTVTVFDARDAGCNVRAVGGDLARGDLALAAGTEIGPHQLALLAALGLAHPVVYRKPRVGILTSGDELVSLERSEEILSGRKLGDVNSPALTALVQEAGGIPVALGIARDDPTAIGAAIAAADDVDLLLTAGGVSVGDHDHMHHVMAALGVTLRFRRARIRPGGPTAFGLLPDSRPWLGLPGNPVSAMVTFELFGRPAIRTMAGARTPFRRTTAVIFDTTAARDPILDQYLRCAFAWPEDGGMPHATLTGPQGSGMLTSVARSEGLVVIGAGEGSVVAGTTVRGWIW